MENLNHLSTLIEKSELESNEESYEEISLAPDQFRLLCDSVETSLAEIDRSVFSLLEFKDKLLLQHLPSHVFLQFVLVFSRFYRSYSQSHVSINELIRLVDIYSQPFSSKCSILKRFHDSNETKKRLLNLAVQKLTSLANQENVFREQKHLDHWEKMYIRLALPRGNIKKWKFRMNTFREKAKLGYEHVIDWSQPKTHRMSLTSDTILDDIESEDQFETIDEIDSQQQQQEESFVMQENEEKDPDLEQITTDESKVEIVEATPKPEIVYIDADVQVEPDCDDEQVSTEDNLFTKSILMHIYRPIGIVKNKLHCIVHTQGRSYTTKTFSLNKSSSRSTTSKKIKDAADKFDKQNADEFLIPMPTILQRRSIFQTDIDPHAIQFDIFGDEILTGSFILTSEDLRMLDLPNLYSPDVSPLIAAENEKSSSSTNKFIDLDRPSTELYQSWIIRTPQLFPIYSKENETIGRLPLLMFWYNKTENRFATKSTMTLPIEIPRIPTPKIEVFVPTATERFIERTSTDDEQIEIIKTNYENEILRLHQEYQDEIQRLVNVINQITTEKDLDSIEQQLPINSYSPSKKLASPNKRPLSVNHSVSNKNNKSFLDRYEMYLQRSIIHRHELTSKIEQQTALQNERQMEVQHRLYKSTDNHNFDNDLCLPAVFMPFQSGNVINPRAYQYFHSIGSSAPRLAQAPTILKFPSLPARSFSVLNLFELSQAYDSNHEQH